MKVARILLALVVVAMVASSLSAQDKGKEKGKGPRGWGSPVDRVLNMKDLNLTDDQKAKLEDLKKEYASKIKDPGQVMQGLLTEDQKKARDDAMKAAKDAGKSGRELFEAGRNAVKLTDDQKAKMKEAFGPREELHQKIQAVLTADQKEKMKKAFENFTGRGKRHEGEKNSDAK